MSIAPAPGDHEDIDTTGHRSARSLMRPGARAAAVIAVAVASAWLSHAAGRRGLFAFDQSPWFDGAYRLLEGQVPYRDFVMPMGVTAFAIQALFMGVVGVSWQAMLIAAATVNAAATVIVYRVVSRLTGGFAISLSSAALTGLWFYPPWGTTNDVQTAFFFLLLAVWAAVAASPGDDRRSIGLLMLTGALSVGIALSKQSAALYSLPLLALLVVAPATATAPVMAPASVMASVMTRGAARLAWTALGGVLTLAGWGLWLVAFSDPAAFWHHAVVLPASVGTARFAGIGPEPELLQIGLPGFVHVLLALAALTGSIELVRPSGHGRGRIRSRSRGLFLLGAVAFEYLFIAKTLNHGSNALPLVGAIFGVTLACVLARVHASVRGFRRVIVAATATAFAIIGLLLVLVGWRVAFDRLVHEGVANARYEASVPVPGLEVIRWAEPTRLGFRGATVSVDDLVSLVGELERRGRPFFVFPDFTFLYGILDQPSPQPWVWFQPRLGYRPEPDPARDRRIIDALEAAGVEVVVIERESFFGWRLDSFPDLDAWIRARFEPARTIGVFLVLEIRRGA